MTEVVARPKILYDFFEVCGGAERFTVELSNLVNGDVLVGGLSRAVLDKLPPLNGDLISISALTRIPVWKTIKGMHAFEKINPELTEGKYCMFSGNNAPVAVHRSYSDRNYYYCHTPPRFAYDLASYYEQELPYPISCAVKQLARYVRAKYEPAIRKMDAVFCNSKNVQSRLKRYLDVESLVLYPPIDTDGYSFAQSNGYYLSNARLEGYKRVEQIVKAFALMPDKKLVVASGGSKFKEIKKLAENIPNVSVIGWVTEKQMKELVSHCIGVIYIPIDEDFGMTPVEAMAAGKPVLGVAEGGVKETVKHAVTGYLCPPSPSIENIIDGVSFLNANRALTMKQDCELSAKSFSKLEFRNRLEELCLIS